jgi:protein-S-isoprenylcysteine O-methyltransferase Ste14
MDENTNITNEINKEESLKDGMVHLILSHSYTVFLMAVVLGLILDVFIPFNIFNNYIYQYGGIILIILGSFLIYWAQSSSNHTKEDEKAGKPRNFEAGPYKYSRNPTHIGLSIMTIGLAFLLNSVFSIILTVIASLVTKNIFLKKEEAVLEQKYGQPYLDYKKKVNTWV